MNALAGMDVRLDRVPDRHQRRGGYANPIGHGRDVEIDTFIGVDVEYRFNRRYQLETMIARLAYVSLRTAPMPYRMLKLADVYA